MKFILPAALLICLVALQGCEKSVKEQLPERKPMILNSGVQLYDDGSQLIDFSNMTISVENTDPLISTVTNNSGSYSLDFSKAPTGLLTVTYSKPGYGLHKNYFYKLDDGVYNVDFNFLPWTKIGEQSSAIDLGKQSSLTVHSLQASIVNSKLVLQFNTTASTPGDKYIRFFYGKHPGLNFNNAIKDARHVSDVVPIIPGNQSMQFCMSCLYQCTDFKKGDTIYLTAYGDAKIHNMYRDFSTGELVFPNINTSSHPTAVWFVLP